LASLVNQTSCTLLNAIKLPVVVKHGGKAGSKTWKESKVLSLLLLQATSLEEVSGSPLLSCLIIARVTFGWKRC